MRSQTRILLVEPEPARQEPLARQLELLGPSVAVTVAGSYGEAPNLAAAQDVILIVPDRGEAEALALVPRLREAAPHAALVVASYENQARTLLPFVRAGCGDGLLLPASSDELRELLLRSRTRGVGPPDDGGRVIAVVGASGGVGCTTVALGLAQALARDPARRVVVADFDFAHGTIAASLGLEPEMALDDLARESLRVDLPMLRRAIARHEPTGLGVLAAPHDIAQAAHVDPDGLRRVAHMVRRAADVAILDTGKGLHATDMLALELADTVLLVVQLDVLTLHRTARLLRLLRGLDGMPERLRLVLNRLGSAASEVGVRKVEQALGLPVTAEIPNAFRAIHRARSNGSALDAGGHGDRTWRAFAELAARVGPEPTPAAVAAAPDDAPHARPRWWPLRARRPTRPAFG